MRILTLWGSIAMPILVLISFCGMNAGLPFQRNAHALVGLGLIMAAPTIAVFLYLYIRRKD